MKTIITLLMSICLLSNLKAQQKITIADFEILNNTNWKGTLTYKNYSDGKEVTLQTTMKITLQGNKIISEIKFPQEPKANSTSKIKIRKNGTYFGDEKIIYKETFLDGATKIITLYMGKDNNRKAKMYKTYLFNRKAFSITKEVEYLNSGEKITRNKQLYKRI